MLRRIALPLLLSLGLASGCADPTGSGLSEQAGSFALETIAGVALPGLVYEDETVTVHVSEGELELTPDWRFQVAYGTQQVRNGVESTHRVGSYGTYRSTEEGLILRDVSGVEEIATLDGERLTLNTSDGQVFVFRRTA